ncbi:alpha/beta fold hydrolase [Streptomyces sp. NRRL F-5727]|uniref:alpha/beta fold hydrolase n=1 Tax=Streptomyces sp. NRRL F-5727 TaxID=1463871 RepID=UPI00055E8452|nr:alpha/beta hydrolase [Streptomyces sp. NRRL F-5727]
MTGLLLVHGAGGSAEGHFGGLLRRLGGRFRWVAGELPGRRGAGVDEVVDGLTAAADDAGVGEFVVCGYSLGAPLAVRLAARCPERVRGVVLTAPFARADHRMRLGLAVWRGLYESGRPRLLAEHLALTGLGESFLDRTDPDRLRAMLMLAPAPPAATPGHLELAARIDVREDLPRLAVPALVVVTAEDPLVSPARQRALAAVVPGARTAELATGHLPFWEDPEGWADLVEEFLAAGLR